MTEAKDNIRRVADSSSSALLVLDNDGRIEMMNQAALDLIQDPVDSGQDRRADQMVEARYLWLASAVEALMGDSAEVVFDKQIITKDGVRPFEVKLFRLVGPERQPRATAAVLDLVSERGRVPVERPVSMRPISDVSLFDDATGLYNRRGWTAIHSMSWSPDRMEGLPGIGAVQAGTNGSNRGLGIP